MRPKRASSAGGLEVYLETAIPRAGTHQQRTTSTSMNLCTRLQNAGTCSKKTCKQSHDLELICFECNIIFTTATEAAQHNQTLEHCRGIIYSNSRTQPRTIDCSLCNIAVDELSWPAHIASKGHKKSRKREGSEVELEFKCEVCREVMLGLGRLQKHNASAEHEAKVGTAKIIARIKQAQQAAGSLSVSHRDQDVDFGVVMLPEPQAAALTQFLSVSTTMREVSLLSATFLDAADGLMSSEV